MDLRKSLFPMLAMALASCGGNAASTKATAPEPTPAAPPRAEAAVAPKTIADSHFVLLYRGVRVIPGTNNVDWSAASFGVMGPSYAMSLYDSMNDADGMPGSGPACWVRISVPVPGPTPPPYPPSSPPVGSTAPLAIPAPPVEGAQPGPWTLQFDNNPAGHWSLTKDQIVGPATQASNMQAATIVGQTFRQLVQAGQATVLPGMNDSCRP